MSDERNGKISGSGMTALAACPGKFNLEKTLPKAPSGEAAEIGIRIHEYIASEGKTILIDSEREIAELIVSKYEEAIEIIGLGKPDKSIRESRLWHGEDWSGQIDRIDFYESVFRNTAIVTDYKSGRIAQTEAADNLQLRAYAVLVKKAYPQLDRIFVSIVQPLAGETTITEYNDEDLRQAESQISAIISKAYQPDAPRIPSPVACKYCSAKSVCPEARGLTSQVMQLASQNVKGLTNDEIAKYLERAEVVEDIIASLKSEAKSRLLAGLPINGYKLENGNSTRSIPNPDSAYERLKEVMTPQEFTKCCKVSAPQLESLLAKSLQIKTKEAKQKLGELLGTELVVKQGEQKMVKE
jgi:CRISPR/Cas system-associated exonuclease Cas4 (RecB family)